MLRVGATCALGGNQKLRKGPVLAPPLYLERCLACSRHHCNLNNKNLIPSSSYLAVVLFNDALLRGHEKVQMFMRFESFNLNQPPPMHRSREPMRHV